MTDTRSRKISALRVAVCASGFALAAAATAGPLPPGFELTVESNGFTWLATNNADAFIYHAAPDGGLIINSMGLIGEGWAIPGLTVGFTTNPSQTNAFTFTNISGSTQTFTVTVDTPGSLSGPTILFGSITGGLTDHGLNGATFGTPVGSSAYTALIDGNPVATLWDDPFSVSTGSPPYTASLGAADFGNLPGPGVMSTISIVHHFTLSAGDSVTLNSAFVVIPGPGGLAALACGFFFIRRRRR